MSKFNVGSVVAAAVSAVITASRAGGETFEGGPGYRREPKSELFLLAVNSFAGEHTYYESASARDTRLRDLIGPVAVQDPDWTLRFVRWLRTDAHLRSIAIVAAAEAVRARLVAGAAGGNRQLVAAALDRADEPGEFVAYWTSRYGRSLPQPVKRGLADAVARLYTERAFLKYDAAQRGFRFADVIELVHPTPRGEWQSDLFRVALDRRHNREHPIPERLEVLRARERVLAVPLAQRRDYLFAPDQELAAGAFTWEQVSGWLQGPMDAAVWEHLIPTMGYMALLRNLRNFDRAGVSNEVAHQVAARLADPDEVARSRQLPLRFLAAFRAAPSLRWSWPLEQALELSCAQVPRLPGRTLVLIDRSGSMFSPLSRRSTVTRADAAGIFGLSLAARAERADVVEFGTTSRRVRLDRGDSVLATAVGLSNLGGTQTAAAIRAHYRAHDRVVILTDEQTGWGYAGADPTESVPARVPTYTFNLVGYELGYGGSGGEHRHTFGGLTDQGFAAIPLLEAGRNQHWPF